MLVTRQLQKIASSIFTLSIWQLKKKSRRVRRSCNVNFILEDRFSVVGKAFDDISGDVPMLWACGPASGQQQYRSLLTALKRPPLTAHLFRHLDSCWAWGRSRPLWIGGGDGLKTVVMKITRESETRNLQPFPCPYTFPVRCSCMLVELGA